MKFLANLVSYVAGIPGGLFSPALAVGAGLGHNLAVLMPSVDPRAVISLELTDTSNLLLPILATVLLARGVSALVCAVPLYRGLAELMLGRALGHGLDQPATSGR